MSHISNQSVFFTDNKAGACLFINKCDPHVVRLCQYFSHASSAPFGPSLQLPKSRLNKKGFHAIELLHQRWQQPWPPQWAFASRPEFELQFTFLITRSVPSLHWSINSKEMCFKLKYPTTRSEPLRIATTVASELKHQTQPVTFLNCYAHARMSLEPPVFLQKRRITTWHKTCCDQQVMKRHGHYQRAAVFCLLSTTARISTSTKTYMSFDLL